MTAVRRGLRAGASPDGAATRPNRLSSRFANVITADGRAVERDTRQRKAIRDAIESANRPLAPMEILERAQESVPGLGIATVYRTVKSLVEEAWALAVELPEGPVRYERAGKGHHHHFVCRNCDGVFEVDGCAPGVKELTPSGFELETHDLVLYGRCEQCVA